MTSLYHLAAGDLQEPVWVGPLAQGVGREHSPHGEVMSAVSDIQHTLESSG